MERLTQYLRWFGLLAIHSTGRNAYLVILSRALRMFAHGTVTLILALFFAELKFSDSSIGFFMTLTLLGDVCLGMYLTMIADRVGRRKILMLGSAMMVTTGIVFATFENYWILLLAAVVGVVSATGGDFGPFRSIEESIIYELTIPDTRAEVLAWYVTTSTLGSAIGSEFSGRLMHFLEGLENWTILDAYHAMFWVYTTAGAVNALLAFSLTDSCEMKRSGAGYEQVALDDRGVDDEDEPMPLSDKPQSGTKIGRWWSGFIGQFSQISSSTLSVMYKFWFLLAVDSAADGMAAYSLTNYYMDEKFHPAKSTLGDMMSMAYFLGAVSSVFAGPLARKIGLVNAMVFSHAPSSASILFFPLPNNLPMTMILLFIRAGLNNMDQAPRGAFIAAVTRPEERTAVLGIIGTLRTLSAMPGPSFTGLLADNDMFWLAFVIAGFIRLCYDFGLFALFRTTELYKHEPMVGERESDEEMR